MITRALCVRLEAHPGREQEVESFLRRALDIVDTEEGTRLWFALPFGPPTPTIERIDVLAGKVDIPAPATVE